jgi:hypothetical protein
VIYYSPTGLGGDIGIERNKIKFDEMMVILPFEKEFYSQQSVSCDFGGALSFRRNSVKLYQFSSSGQWTYRASRLQAAGNKTTIAMVAAAIRFNKIWYESRHSRCERHLRL